MFPTLLEDLDRAPPNQDLMCTDGNDTPPSSARFAAITPAMILANDQISSFTTPNLTTTTAVDEPGTLPRGPGGSTQEFEERGDAVRTQELNSHFPQTKAQEGQQQDSSFFSQTKCPTFYGCKRFVPTGPSQEGVTVAKSERGGLGLFATKEVKIMDHSVPGRMLTNHSSQNKMEDKMEISSQNINKMEISSAEYCNSESHVRYGSGGPGMLHHFSGHVTPGQQMGQHQSLSLSNPNTNIIFQDTPLFHIQHTPNKRCCSCCANCGRFVGGLGNQVETLFGGEDHFAPMITRIAPFVEKWEVEYYRKANVRYDDDSGAGDDSVAGGAGGGGNTSSDINGGGNTSSDHFNGIVNDIGNVKLGANINDIGNSNNTASLNSSTRAANSNSSYPVSSNTSPHPNEIISRCECGETYCNEECRKKAWEHSHELLCVANIVLTKDGDAENHPLFQFKMHAIEHCDTLLLCLQVYASILQHVRGKVVEQASTKANGSNKYSGQNGGNIAMQFCKPLIDELLSYVHDDFQVVCRPPADGRGKDEEFMTNTQWVVGRAYDLLGEYVRSEVIPKMVAGNNGCQELLQLLDMFPERTSAQKGEEGTGID